MEFTTEVQQASQLLQILQKLDGAVAGIELEVMAQDRTIEDPMPDGKGGNSDVTYASRMDEIRMQRDRLIAGNEHLMDTVEKVRKMQIAREKKELVRGLAEAEAK